jgi:hypothetical protein
MHLREIFRIRGKTAAGVYMLLTRRCPMSCAHCSTQSHPMATDELSREPVEKFIDSFEGADPPELLCLSGGEALLRPALVKSLVSRAAKAGTSTYLMSGMFFASEGRVPRPVRQAVAGLAHFSASIDRYHEKFVPREAALKALASIRDLGVSISIQSVANGREDPYFHDLLAEIETYFGRSVPVFYLLLKPIGRAAEWFMPGSVEVESSPISPCKVASWPTVSFDGHIYACCNQRVIEGGQGQHLSVGHIEEVDWRTVRARMLERPVLRLIRTLGPTKAALLAGSPIVHGQCRTCSSIRADADADARMASAMMTPRSKILEAYVSQASAEPGAFGVDPGDSKFLLWGT